MRIHERRRLGRRRRTRGRPREDAAGGIEVAQRHTPRQTLWRPSRWRRTSTVSPAHVGRPRCLASCSATPSKRTTLSPPTTRSASSHRMVSRSTGPSPTKTLMVVGLRRWDDSDARRSRIAVVGDSDFATNSFFHIMGNGTLFVNTINYLAAQENLIGLQPRTSDLPRMQLTNRQMKGTFFLAVVLVPAALAVVGTAVWWKQH